MVFFKRYLVIVHRNGVSNYLSAITQQLLRKNIIDFLRGTENDYARIYSNRCSMNEVFLRTLVHVDPNVCDALLPCYIETSDLLRSISYLQINFLLCNIRDICIFKRTIENDN